MNKFPLLWLLLLLCMACSTCTTALSASSLQKRVAVIGGTGRLGRQAVVQLAQLGIPVNCLVRFDPSTVSAKPLVDGVDIQNVSLDELRCHLKSLPGVTLMQGDASSLEDLKELLGQDCTSCLALHGATRMSKLSDLFKDAESEPNHAKQINYVGIGHLIQAAQDSKSCKRLVRITGKGEDPWSFFSILINMLGSMAKGWNYEGETLLRKSNVDYTIIRPGVMKQDFKRDPNEAILQLADNGGDLKVTPVSYQDIASLAVESLEYPNAARTTLTAMNVANDESEGEASYAPLLAKVQPDSREFPATLIEEHKRAVKRTIVVLGSVLACAAIGILNVVKSMLFG